MGWEDESKYARKTDLEEYTKKNTFNKKITEIEATLEKKITKDDLPDHSIYALKKDIPIINMNDYIKKSEINTIITQNVGYILNALLPHLNHRYCTNELFNKIRRDLNVKLKKLDHRWRDV